jgi:glutamate N-acetyltransferase/amino-acid N-acetyltransferase
MMDEHPGVAGFRFSGISAGIKASGDLDLALLAAEEESPAAAVFTANRVRAAPVEIARARIASGRAQAVLVNSGNANACTGREGERAAKRTTAAVADAIGAPRRLVLPASTGVIGRPLPAALIEAAVPALVARLAADGAGRFARAIMTTDRWPKMAAVEVDVGGARATVLGIAKGAGMIHPDLATTLAFVVTDASVGRGGLARALRGAVDETFNALTVDGETSTNDTIVAMASGRVGGRRIRRGSAAAVRFAGALRDVLGQLGRSIVRDGEGARTVVTLHVVGASSDRAARKVARRVAGSLLVKTAIHGRDPNWGRVLSAAGCAGVSFEPSESSLAIGDVTVMKRGTAVPGAEAAAAAVMVADEFPVELRIGRGPGSARYLFCDVGHDYVTVNADYRT